MFIRPLFTAASIASLVALAACTATVAPNPGIVEQPHQKTDGIAIDATDTMDIVVSGGMPAPCPGSQGYTASSDSVHVDFAAKTLHETFTAACPASDGTPVTTEKEVTFTDAQRDVLLADVRALVLETVEYCGADAPDQRVTVTHEGGTSESHLVNQAQNTCEKGKLEIRAAEYTTLENALDALLK